MSWGDLEYSNTGCVTEVRGVKTFAQPMELKFSQSQELRGYATRFRKLHVYEGKLDYFLPGVFARTLASKAAVRLVVDHDESKLIATTADRLELHSDEKGLAFRCDLAGIDADDLALIGDRRGMSIKYQLVDAKEVDVEGSKVRVIRDAELHEITVCHRGVVKEAFAIWGEKTDAQSLRDLCTASGLLVDGAGDAVTRAFERVKRALGA